MTNESDSARRERIGGILRYGFGDVTEPIPAERARFSDLTDMMRALNRIGPRRDLGERYQKTG